MSPCLLFHWGASSVRENGGGCFLQCPNFNPAGSGHRSRRVLSCIGPKRVETAPGVPRHQHLGHLEETPATGLVRGTAAATEGRMEGHGSFIPGVHGLVSPSFGHIHLFRQAFLGNAHLLLRGVFTHQHAFLTAAVHVLHAPFRFLQTGFRLSPSLSRLLLAERGALLHQLLRQGALVPNHRLALLLDFLCLSQTQRAEFLMHFAMRRQAPQQILGLAFHLHDPLRIHHFGILPTVCELLHH
mmetsp:Transcript_20761/g.45660  ORF Transcript_20761/g.45660 Transcript_20761/m.45660 type:complete len:242 (+) Transcript_20761:166-891(+)